MAVAQMQKVKLERVLGPFEAFCLVVSAVLGSSIFLVPSTVAGMVPFFAGIAGVWIAGGLLSLAGALTYAELGAMLPEAGGGYVYLEKAFGPLLSFLFVWTDFLLVRAGAAAAIIVGFAAYLSALWPAPAPLTMRAWQACIAISFIILLGLLNVLGTRLSGMVQVLGTLFKAGALLTMIALPWVLRHVHIENLQPMLPVRWTPAVWQGLLAAMVPVMWSYGGWDQLSHMSEEVTRPEKNIARAFGFGLACAALLYAGAALAIHTAFPIAKVASSQAIGVDFFRELLGSPGGVLITMVVMFAAVTSAHVALMSGSRSCFAIARDGLFPAPLARLHPRFGTPANAVIALTAWACLLVGANALWGGTRPLYLTLVTYVMFGLVLFGALICAAAIQLRRAHPEWKRPYRVWGYPFTPLASIVVSLFLLWSMLRTSPGESFAALAIILAGWPVYSRAARKLTHDANRLRI